MIRSFVFNEGKLAGQDPGLDFIRMMLFEEDAQIWVDLEEPTEAEWKEVLEAMFAFHPLAIEDCVAVSEQPKIDEYDKYLFLVLHAIDYSNREHAFQTRELNMFIGRNFLVTYHDKPLPSILSTIERIRRNAHVVARAPDRLSYTILDFMLDNYEPAIEELSADIAELERTILSAEREDILEDVLELKSEVRRLRQIITPQREVISRIARGDFKLIRPHLLPYFRDLLDRVKRISDLSDTYRESLTSVLQVNLNLQQMQINRVIKVLTVLATLSLPLVMVTSFYGMNFHHMPELAWEYGYLWVFGITAGCTGLIYLYLKRKHWL